MKYTSTVLSVADVKASKKFYVDLFGLELFQDYGINIAFTCGLSLQQEFHWLTNLPKDKVLQGSNNMELCFEEEEFDDFLKKLKDYPGVECLGGVMEHGWGQRVIRFYDPDRHIIEVGEPIKGVIQRFLDAGMSMDQVALRMDASKQDLQKLLDS